MNKYVKSDIYRIYGEYNFRIFLKSMFKNPTLRFQYAFRMCNAETSLKRVWGRLLWRMNKTKKNISIPINTKIGYGLYIGHGGPVIVNYKTEIGNNVNLSPFLVIGSNKGTPAKIGDNVLFLATSVSIDLILKQLELILYVLYLLSNL